jgi:hypothetical protein
MGLFRAALIFGAGYAVGDPTIRGQLVGKATELVKRPELRKIQGRGRDVAARAVGRSAPAASPGAPGGSGDPSSAPDPDSREFLEGQNPVEKLSQGTTADAPATEPGLISTDPAPSDKPPTA